MSAPRFEIVRTDAEQPWHARFRAANGRVVWTTENYARRRSAYRAILSIGDLLSPHGAWVDDEWLNLWADDDPLGEKWAVPIRAIDERACSCGSRETTSLNPAEVVVHRVGRPCYIAARVDERAVS